MACMDERASCILDILNGTGSISKRIYIHRHNSIPLQPNAGTRYPFKFVKKILEVLSGQARFILVS